MINLILIKIFYNDNHFGLAMIGGDFGYHVVHDDQDSHDVDHVHSVQEDGFHYIQGDDFLYTQVDARFLNIQEDVFVEVVQVATSILNIQEDVFVEVVHWEDNKQAIIH